MVLDRFWEDNVEIVFAYMPAWEMFFSMHVLADSDHHLYRKRWAKRICEREPGLYSRIIELGEITGTWVFVIDSPEWSRIRQMEIGEMLSFLRRKNIYQWNEMLKYSGRQMDIAGRDEVLWVIREYYERIFQREERLLRPYLTRILQKEMEQCRRKGIWQWCQGIHPRLLVEEECLIYWKDREYCYQKENVHRIYATASTFVNPHLWLYKGEGELEMVKGVLTEQAEDEIPEKCAQVFKALGDKTRLRIVKLLMQGTLTTQEISREIGISEAGVSKHLRILNEAVLVSKSMKGHYVEYHFLTEMIDFIPYTFYEMMM